MKGSGEAMHLEVISLETAFKVMRLDQIILIEKETQILSSAVLQYQEFWHMSRAAKEPGREQLIR